MDQFNRSASQLVPRGGRACSASQTTLRKLRYAGTPSRAASKLQATDAAPSALRGAWNSTNGTSGEPHECRDHAETFTLTYQSISLTHRPVYYTFVGHAGDTTSTRPIQSFAGVDQQ